MTQIRTIPGVSNAVTDFSDGLRSEGRDVVTDAHIVPIRGAEGDGTTNDTTAINTWIAADKIKILSNGDYLASGSVTSFSHPTIILADNAKESGDFLPLISICGEGINFKNIPNPYVFVKQTTSERTSLRTFDIRRDVDTDDGYTNPHALHVETNKLISSAATEWAISASLVSYSNTADNGSTALSGTADKYGTASVFAGHFQAREFFKTSTATDVTGLPAVEINVDAIGLDHPTANSYTGNRRGIVILPKTMESVSGWDTATGNYGAAEIGAGIHISSDTVTDAYFRYGIIITEGTGNANAITTGIQIGNNGLYGLNLVGSNTVAHVRSTGTVDYGVLLLGTYAGAALRINSGQFIVYEATNAIKTGYDSVGGVWSLKNGSTERFGVVASSGSIRVNGVQVIGARDTGWTAMTGTANENTAYDTATVTLAQLAGRVMALQTALTTHGLIGA
jgi:hypothetical protein